MSKPLRHNSGPLSVDELRNIIKTHLPAWFRACAAKADAIVMHEAAFGTSEGELLHFACAIKYAANTGKTVHVTCASSDADSATSFKLPQSAIDSVYRDRVNRGNIRPTKTK